MSKPKEWWIVSPELTKHPFGESYNAVHTVTDYESTDSVHVIEYSAYAEVLAKLEELRKSKLRGIDWDAYLYERDILEKEIGRLKHELSLLYASDLHKERAINAVLVEALGAISMAQPEGKQSIVPSIALEFTTNQAREALTKAKEMRDGE